MANIAPFAFFQLLDNNGDPLSGGKLYTYDAGTTTPKTTYTSEDESAANTNPIILDANGRADVWLAEGEYKFVLTDSADNTIDTIDNVQGNAANSIVSYDISANTNIVSSYNFARIYGTSTFTISLLPAADAEDGFEFYVFNEGAGSITIDPDGSELINGASTLVLTAGQWAIISCDGAEWHAFVNELTASSDITFSGDITFTGDVVLPNGVVDFADIQNISNYTVMGNVSGGAAAPAEVSILDEDDFASNSDTALVTQQSVKAYVDGKTNIATASASSDPDMEIGIGTDDFYEISIKATPETDGQDLCMQISTDGGTSYKNGASDYSWQMQNYATGAAGANDDADTEIHLTRLGVGSDTGELVTATIWIYDPSDSSEHTYIKWVATNKTAAGSLSTVHGSATYNANTAVNGARFYFASGDMSGKLQRKSHA